MTPQALTKALDFTKSRIFTDIARAPFFGSLMCSYEVVWDSTCSTAYAAMDKIGWNPEWFATLPEPTRHTVLMHELWHIAQLHHVRMGPRDPEVWNYACDYWINNMLTDQGFSFEGTKPLRDSSFQGMAEEDIYDHLIANPPKMPKTGTWGVPQESDLRNEDGDNSKASQQMTINNVVQAVQAAEMCNQAGAIPGSIKEFLNRFLKPVVPWEVVLHNFFTDLLSEDYSWKRPNRRHQDVYLPSLVQENDRLEHLIYYLDVSGSISTEDVVRFNSEVKFIKDTFKPLMLTLVQFDTEITSEQVFLEDDPFDGIEVVGRGGTSLRCVRQHIITAKPTAAIIFSDLYVTPMEPIPDPIPVVWIGLNNPEAKVPFGKLIHIRT